jgi:hypothetical protein
LLVTRLPQVTAVPQVDKLCSRPYDTPHTLRGIGRGVAGGSPVLLKIFWCHGSRLPPQPRVERHALRKVPLADFFVRPRSPERGKIAPWKIFGNAL